MIVENISWSISTKECCRPRRGLNPRPPGLQSDGASNWATEGVYIILLISAQNIDCGYSFESPRRCGSNEYSQSMFWAEIWKISDVLVWFFFFFFLAAKFSVHLNRQDFVMRFGSIWLIVWEETWFEEFQDGYNGSHLGYWNRRSLAILLFVLRFYDPVNPLGSCRALSVYLTTLLLGRLSSLSG